MKKSLKQSILFIIIVYFSSWLFWIPLINKGHFPFSNNLLLMAGIYMPSIIGILMTKMFARKTSLIQIMKSLFHFKIQLKEYLFILGYFPIMIGLSFSFMKIIGIPLTGLNYPIKVFPLVFFYILVLQGPLGEEFGWRGFLMDWLMMISNPMMSSLILGVIWSFWHLPLFLIDGTIQFQMMEKFSLIPTLSGYLIYTICISLLITIVYLRTNKSVWAAILFHTIANTTIGYAPIILHGKGSLVLMSSLFLVTALSIKWHLKVLVKK